MSQFKLGILTAILGDMTFEEAIHYAHSKGLDSVELACWPQQKESRRYAGTSHFNAEDLSIENIERVKHVLKQYHIEISSLGYYPNPLDPNPVKAQQAINHIKKLIYAASALGIHQITTFIGRNKYLSHAENMDLFVKTWKQIVELAEAYDVRIAFENCPMIFTYDEYPGGLNLATSPAIFEEMFKRIPNRNFGLNFDPSHFVWQQMDYIQVLKQFKDRIFHIHIKDALIDREKLNHYGILVPPLHYMSPKLPGLGEINWKAFFKTLKEIGYSGHYIIEFEDKAFEDSFEKIDQGITQSIHYIRNIQ